MKTALILSILVTMTFGCKEQSRTASASKVEPEAVKLPKPIIRDISINGGSERFGIELNGDRAFFRLEAEVTERLSEKGMLG